MTKNIKHQRGTARKSFLIFLVIILLSPVIIFAINQRFNIHSRADGIDAIAQESEGGILSAGATVGADSSASGGKYLEFTTASSQSFQPSAPYHATFFYLWYKNRTTDGGWSYWTDHGNTPPTTWFSHYLPDRNPAAFDPAGELYSSNSYDTFKWQASKLAEARQEVAIASWWGQGTKEDQAFKKIIGDFMSRTDNPYPNLRWAMYYEDEGFEDPSVATLVNDLNYVKTTFANSPYMLKINGKPVMFVYAGANDVPGTMTQRWYQANQEVGNSFYVVLKVFPGYETAQYQPSSWHQYAPAVVSGVHGTHSAFVSPGFWLDDGSAVRLGRDAAAFEAGVNQMNAAKVTWKLVETWNEWGEGTSVEPGTPVRKNAAGAEEVDPAAPAFGNLYINILKKILPPLEQGTGSSM